MTKNLTVRSSMLESYIIEIQRKISKAKASGQKIKIAFTGPSGTGKSTLAKEVANTLGLNYIENSAGFIMDPKTREALQKEYPWKGEGHKEIIRLSNTYPDFGIAFQLALLRDRNTLIKENSNFVIDRSPLDNLAYFTLQCSHNVHRKGYEDFISLASDGIRELSHVILITTPGKNEGYEVEDNSSRVSSYYYQRMVSQVFEFCWNEYLRLSSGNTKVLHIPYWHFETRAVNVMNFLGYSF